MTQNFNAQANFNPINAKNQAEEKIKEFKKRLQAFENISTLEEAKKIAKEIMPVSKEINHFRVGSAKCVIINKDDMFRICLDSDEEFISYDFS